MILPNKKEIILIFILYRNNIIYLCMAKNENETTFLLRIDKKVKEQAEKLAKKSDRSLNGLLNNLIKSELIKYRM